MLDEKEVACQAHDTKQFVKWIMEIKTGLEKKVEARNEGPDTLHVDREL